jgi:hypothetical protein
MIDIRNYGPRKITLAEVKRGTREVVEQEHNVMPLSEASLNQMMEHGKTGMVIISSQVSSIERDDPELDLTAEFEKSMEKKGGIQSIDSDALYDEMQDWLRRRNAFADRQLRKDIHDAGFSYTPVFGGYKMQETGEECHEPSYVVYCYDKDGQPRDFQELKDFALRMCGKYKQESVYIQAPGEPPVYLDRHGDQMNSSSSNNFKFNRDNETYFTTTGRDKSSPQRFTADIVFENLYIPIRPGDYNERMRRDKSGEYIL